MNKTHTSAHVHMIVTHIRPHVDEIVAIVLLQHYGKKHFPGIVDARIEFWDAGSRTQDGKDWKQHLKEGHLLVGLGGSCFDEHPSVNTERKEEHCAATLVAKYLGIEDRPELEQLLRYTLVNDTKGGNNIFDLAALITLGNKRWFDSNPQEILEWAMQPVVWYLEKQIKFFTKTREEFEKFSNIINCIYKGREITIVAIQSDDPDVGAYSRSQYGVNAAIVIQQNYKGQVMISSQKRAKICFNEVIIELRKKEARFKNISYSGLKLDDDGTIPEIPEWYYDKPAARILNGALSAPNVPVTKIPLEEIVKLVQRELNKNFKK